jgi:hypothetical protein
MDLKDFFESINKSKKNIISDEKSEKCYIPYVINKSFSYHKDSIFYSNMMNRWSNLDKKMQYDYYLYGLPKGQRYAKWHKDEDSSVEPIMAYYGYSRDRAREVARILSNDQIEAIKQALNTGGKP